MHIVLNYPRGYWQIFFHKTPRPDFALLIGARQTCYGAKICQYPLR